jgi:TrmH family RNA methyltransferase
VITSPHNPLIKYVRSLERSQVRRAEGVYLIEGVRLVGEAIAAGQHATIVLFAPSLLQRSEAGSRLLPRLASWADRSYEVDERVLAAAAQTETPAGVLAVARRTQPPALAVHAHDRFGLILDRLADPGNAGTILRTADAAGVDYVVALPGTVDLFSPKVARAGMGAHFRLPLYPGVPWPELAEALPDMTLVAIDAGGEQLISRFVWPERTALIVGSEAHGLSPEASRHVAHRVRIPMKAGVESLNASVAASIAVYLGTGSLISPTI